MGVLGRFEKGIERAVNGAFARAFRSEVQPVELASAIKREADDNASVVGRNRTIRRTTMSSSSAPPTTAAWRSGRRRSATSCQPFSTTTRCSSATPSWVR